jgi:hypothetical protein
MMSKGLVVLMIILSLIAGGAAYLRWGLIPKWNDQIAAQKEAEASSANQPENSEQN